VTGGVRCNEGQQRPADKITDSRDLDEFAHRAVVSCADLVFRTVDVDLEDVVQREVPHVIETAAW